MKNNLLRKVAIFMLLTALLTNTALASSSHTPWLNIQNFKERQDYYIDRGEACKYLIDTYVKLTSTTPPAIKSSVFTDINPNESPSVLQAYSLGIIKGTSKTTFEPTRTITKGELAIMISNLVKKTFPTVMQNGSEQIKFPDKMETYMLKPAQFVYSRGIFTRKSNGYLGINDKVSLKEMAAVMNKTVQAAPNFKIISTSFTHNRAYLTFDDSPSKNTSKILDILKKYNVKATFFVTAKADPDLLKRMNDEGHVIGNHSMTHKYEDIYFSPENFWNDFKSEQDYIQNAVGTSSIFFRFPGGSNNTPGMKNKMMETLTSQMKEKGYIYVDWNVSSGDANAKTVPKETIVSNVLNGAKNKSEAIILMHQTADKTTTVEALPEIIEGLGKMGFQLSELLPNSYTPQFID